MAGRGGARPGAGRKPKAEKFARPIAAAEKRIADKLPFLIDKQFELAEGVPLIDNSKALKYLIETIQTACPDAERVERVVAELKQFFSTAPDRQAIQYLVDRIMGKPTEKQEIDQTITDIRVLMDV